ncbi:hypothetical protein M5D96_006704 [Drosophila gunungcola]|uniref:Uncharacterized protein n=1 Tax=Drosophila gunungcola TaxID=103775 RepID=A0A9Q0BQR9_9MUSC|nr:hypothetical protein M5D96_006704 [Drosophila gunungcola]
MRKTKHVYSLTHENNSENTHPENEEAFSMAKCDPGSGGHWATIRLLSRLNYSVARQPDRSSRYEFLQMASRRAEGGGRP